MRLILSTVLCLSLVFQSTIAVQANQRACEGNGSGGPHSGQVLSVDDGCCLASVIDPGSDGCSLIWLATTGKHYPDGRAPRPHSAKPAASPNPMPDRAHQ